MAKDLYAPYCLQEKYFIARRVNNKLNHELSIIELGTWQEKKLLIEGFNDLEDVYADQQHIYTILNYNGRRLIQAIPLNFEQRIWK